MASKKKTSEPVEQNFTREFETDHLSGGEDLRAELEEKLGYPKTDLFESSPVGVTAVGGKLVVRITAEKEPSPATWAKVADAVAAHAG